MRTGPLALQPLAPPEALRIKQWTSRTLTASLLLALFLFMALTTTLTHACHWTHIMYVQRSHELPHLHVRHCDKFRQPMLGPNCPSLLDPRWPSTSTHWQSP